VGANTICSTSGEEVMLCFLDTCIVIYAVEGQAPFQQRARTHLAALEEAGHSFIVSDLTRNECLVKPLGAGAGPLLLQYSKFFAGPQPAHRRVDFGHARASVADSRKPLLCKRKALFLGGCTSFGGRNRVRMHLFLDQ
jgi:hypothetical protein